MDTQDNAIRGGEEEEIKCKSTHRTRINIRMDFTAREVREKNRITDRCKVSSIVAIAEK